MKSEDINYMFGEMVQRSEHLFFTSLSGSEDRIHHLPALLEALASIVRELDTVRRGRGNRGRKGREGEGEGGMGRKRGGRRKRGMGRKRGGRRKREGWGGKRGRGRGGEEERGKKKER